MRITKNFRLREFVSTSHDIVLAPNGRELDNIIELAQTQMQPMRDLFSKPIIITSGFRNKRLNLMVGGSKTSEHLKGRACDFYIRKDKKKDLLWDAAQILTFINFGKLIVYINEDRFHISSGDKRLAYLKFPASPKYYDMTEYLKVIK